MSHRSEERRAAATGRDRASTLAEMVVGENDLVEAGEAADAIEFGVEALLTGAGQALAGSTSA
jgi:hypothetical protein